MTQITIPINNLVNFFVDLSEGHTKIQVYLLFCVKRLSLVRKSGYHHNPTQTLINTNIARLLFSGLWGNVTPQNSLA